MIVYTHNDCLKKFNGLNHPERKERLISILKALKSSPELKIVFKEAPIAKMCEIILVHPKDYIDRIFNIQQLTKMDSGGHFAALEKPQLLIKDILEFFKLVKI